MNRFVVSAMAAFAVALSLSANIRAERVYGEKILGTECPSLAQAMIDAGLAKSFYGYKPPDHSRQPRLAFSSDTFTFCKVTFKHEGPMMMFTKADIPTERRWQADEILRSDGFDRVIKAQCAGKGGTLSESFFYSPMLVDRPSWLCSRDGQPIFMAAHYTHSIGVLDNANRYVLVVAEPKTPGTTVGADFAELLGEYGFKSGPR